MIRMRHGEVDDVKRIMDNDEVALDDEIKKMEEQKDILKVNKIQNCCNKNSI